MNGKDEALHSSQNLVKKTKFNLSNNTKGCCDSIRKDETINQNNWSKVYAIFYRSIKFILGNGATKNIKFLHPR